MLVSVVIPAREWDHNLESTLDTVRFQQVSGGVEIESIVGLAGPPPSVLPERVRVVPNPSGTIPDALNLAVAAAAGEVVVRVDSRCDLQPDHVRRVLQRLEDPAVGCVGGAQLVLDRGVFGSAYAVAFNSPLLGPSKYRYSTESGPVDTAYLGAWRRDDLNELGGFDPRLIRNQDNELAARVRDSGRVVWYDSGLVVGYHNARGFRASAAHHHEFGVWRLLQSSQGQQGLQRKHALALGAVLAGAATVGAGLLHPATRRAMTAVSVVGYFGVAGGAYRYASRLRRRRPDIPDARFNALGVVTAPAIAAVIDLAWAAGVLRGMRTGRRLSSTDLSSVAPEVH